MIKNNEGKGYLVDLILDPESFVRATPEVEHERAVAIFDLLEENCFQPKGKPIGGHVLTLSITNQRLIFDITINSTKERVTHILSLTPLRAIMKDYYLICESYYDAIRGSATAKIEAIDMARRGVHNEASEILRERLKDKIEMDIDTARRLFTLICALAHVE